MAKRSVELAIKVQGAKTISDLENVISEINAELKNVDVNSQAFEELSAQARKADGQLKTVSEKIAGFSDPQKVESVAKLGGALAASLSVATVAAQSFGEESSESIQKAIATATSLTVVINAIKPIMEALSATNRRAFGEFLSGFKQAGIGAKLFGNTTRTAIASTGIGLLIIALGTLIANWDSVTKSVKEFGESIPFVKKIIDGVQELIDKVGSLSNLFNGVKAFVVGLFTAGKDAVDELYKALETGKALEALQKQAEAIELQNKGRDRQIKLLEAQGKKEQQIVELKRESFEAELNNLQSRKDLGEELDKNQLARIEDLKLELDLLDIRSKKLAEEAKKAAFDKANAEGKRLLEQSRLAEDIAQADADKQREVNQKLQDDLLASFKNRKEEEVKVTSDLEIEKEQVANSTAILGKKREEALLQNSNAVKKRLEDKFNQEVRDERIKILSEISDRTIEQDEELADLRTEKYKEFIDNVTPFIQESLNGVNQISQAITDSLSRNIEGLQIQLDSLNLKYQESTELRKSFEQELANVQGTARDQVLASIDEERKKEKQLADDRKKIQNQIISAQNKTNQVEYANSLLNSIVQGALAVTEALPNVPLSILVGTLSAIQTGIIAANPPQPIPTFAKGGFTGKGFGFVDSTGHQPVGIVHDNEWVANSTLVKNPAIFPILQTLDALQQGMKPFADGGFTSTPVPTFPDNAISNSLSPESFKAAIESARIFVSAQEVRDVTTNVNVIESRASI